MASSFFQIKSNAKKTTEKHVVDTNLQPWVEKYPGEDTHLDESPAYAVLRSTRDSPDNFRTRVLELNASDERGISIVREKIKNFARQTPRAQTVASDGKSYPCPPYKIIILDEADSMTQDAQAALRRIMENYARITRFCLVCNYVTRIIEPLASRCSKFRFKPLDSSSASTRLEYIAATEQVPVTAPVISALISTSSGDLRRAITYM
ncbi:hypothetical protein EWM64_g5444, partial [Hericium alpestre]